MPPMTAEHDGADAKNKMTVQAAVWLTSESWPLANNPPVQITSEPAQAEGHADQSLSADGVEEPAEQ